MNYHNPPAKTPSNAFAEPMSHRFLWLDAIRFVAASFVILTHLIEVFIVRQIC